MDMSGKYMHVSKYSHLIKAARGSMTICPALKCFLFGVGKGGRVDGQPFLTMCVYDCNWRSEFLNVPLSLSLHVTCKMMLTIFDLEFLQEIDNVYNIVSHMDNLQKTNLNKLVGSVHMNLTSKCHFSVPLCR